MRRELLPRDVQVESFTPGKSRHVEVMTQWFPESEWLGGWFDLQGTALRVLGWRAGPLWVSARVTNEGQSDATVAIHQLRCDS